MKKSRNKFRLETAQNEFKIAQQQEKEFDNEHQQLLEKIQQLELENQQIDEKNKELVRKIFSILICVLQENEIETHEHTIESVSQIQQDIQEKHDLCKAEEDEMISEIVKQQTHIFLLKENIHSFSIFKDYFSDTDNL